MGTKKNSDNSGEFEDELDSELEGKAQPAAGGVPQLTVGGAPQHTGMSETDQTEWFSSPMSENSAENFMSTAPMAVAHVHGILYNDEMSCQKLYCHC